MYTYIYIYIYIYTHLYTPIHLYIYTSIHLYIIYIYIYTLYALDDVLGFQSAQAWLCFQHLCLPFRPLPHRTWPIICGNSTGLHDPTLLRLPPTLLPFEKQSPASKGMGRQGTAVKHRISLRKEPTPCRPVPSLAQLRGLIWLRTNGVNTNGAPAKVVNFDSLGKKVRPGTFGKIQIG